MIDFPNSPTNGQVFTSVNTSWIYDGSKWLASNSPAAAFLPLTGGTLTGALVLTVPLAATSGGTAQTTWAQGDLMYASAANTLAKLAKDATATRYLSNTGATNNPAWAQINLANGVTGTLPVLNGGSGATTAAGAPWLPLTGGTLTGGLTIAPASGSSQIVLTKPASGVAAAIYSFTGANWRWALELGNTVAESGSNAGSDFGVSRYSDAGVNLGAPLTISRATGAATFTGPVTSVTTFISGNNQGLWGKDSGGTPRLLLVLSTDNSIYIGDNLRGITLQGAVATTSSVAVTTNVHVAGPAYGAIRLNTGDATVSGWLGLYLPNGTRLGYLGNNTAAPGFVIESGGQFTMGGGHLYVTNGQVLSQGASAMLSFQARDNAAVAWAWYSIGGAARLWYSPSGDRVTVDTGGNLVTAANLQANSGRIISTTPTASAGAVVCCYEVPSGYAAGLIQTQNYLYIARQTGDGSYHSTLAYFVLSDAVSATSMTMGGMGIRYPAAAYGSASAIAFGWGAYPGFPSHVAVSIDNGGAAYPLGNASDTRMKTDIAPSKFDALATINQIPLKEFRWINITAPDKLKEARADKKTSGSLKRIGVIAQEVAEVFPEGVVEGDVFEDKLGRVWTLDQNIMIAALIGSVQQLSAEVQALREKVG